MSVVPFRIFSVQQPIKCAMFGCLPTCNMTLISFRRDRRHCVPPDGFIVLIATRVGASSLPRAHVIVPLYTIPYSPVPNGNFVSISYYPFICKKKLHKMVQLISVT